MCVGDMIPEWLMSRGCWPDTDWDTVSVLLLSGHGLADKVQSEGTELNLCFPFRSEILSLKRKKEIKLYSFMKGDFLVPIKGSGRKKYDPSN